jgi:protein SCO1/2
MPVTRQFRRFLLVALTTAGVLAPAAAQNVGTYGRAPRPANGTDPGNVDLPVEQKLGTELPLDGTFYDHTSDGSRGTPVTIRQLMGGKPTILVPAYYRCPKLCNEVLNGLLVALRDLRKDDPRWSAGDKFNVVAFSIDARESQLLAKPKREYYLHEYDGRSPEQPGWWFLTATPGQFNDAGIPVSKSTIREVTNALGYPFRFVDGKLRRDPETGRKVIENEWGEMVPFETADTDLVKRMQSRKEMDIEHPAVIAVLTPDGRVSRYLFGVDYPTGTLKDALMTAANGKIGQPATRDGVLACFTTDQVSEHYQKIMTIMTYVSIPVGLTVLAIGGYVIRRARKEGKAVKADTGSQTGPTNAD